MASHEAAAAVKAKHSAALLGREEVTGVGTALRSDQEWVLRIHVIAGAAPEGLPTELDGVPVDVVADGPYIARPSLG